MFFDFIKSPIIQFTLQQKSSMSDNSDIEKFALQLREAAISKVAIDPLRESIGVENIALAYKIQSANNLFRVSKGARIVGKKIGLTSVSVQKQLGVDQPDFGILFNDMEVQNGGTISIQEIMQPKVEAEIAFVLKSDLTKENLTTTEVIKAIDFALPSIEIVGSRIKNWNIKITDTVADNASASHFVVGHRPTLLRDFDMINCKMEMTINDEVVSTGSGSACLGSPINATVWLANKMVKMGSPLLAGEVILSGAVGPMAQVKAGDLVTASIEGLGSVSVRFEA